MKKILVIDSIIKRGQPAPILQESEFEVRLFSSFYRMMTPAVKYQPDLVICIIREKLEAKAKNKIKFLKGFPETEHIPVMILLGEAVGYLTSQYVPIADIILSLSIDEHELRQNVKMILDGGIR